MMTSNNEILKNDYFHCKILTISHSNSSLSTFLSFSGPYLLSNGPFSSKLHIICNTEITTLLVTLQPIKKYRMISFRVNFRQFWSHMYFSCLTCGDGTFKSPV